MIAIDTNILVYAHRADFPEHHRAAQKLIEVSERPWAIPWPCLHEFFSVLTGARLLNPPTSTRDALAQIDTLLKAPTLRLLHETPSHWPTLRRLIEDGRIKGKLIHDAKIAAICLQHGVREFWSADRDFSRFPELKTINPLL